MSAFQKALKISTYNAIMFQKGTHWYNCTQKNYNNYFFLAASTSEINLWLQLYSTSQCGYLHQKKKVNEFGSS